MSTILHKQHLYIDSFIEQIRYNTSKALGEDNYMMGDRQPMFADQKEYLMNLIEMNPVESIGIVSAPVFYVWDENNSYEPCEVHTRLDFLPEGKAKEQFVLDGNVKTIFFWMWYEVQRPLGEGNRYRMRMFTSDKVLRLQK